MRWWLTLVARRKSEELFVLNLLLVTLGLAWLTQLAGLSLALGAFVAGMLIAETEFKHQVETDIRPFHDVLLGLFFITIGMKLDWRSVLAHWPLVLALTIAPVLFKFVLVTVLARVVRRRAGVALRTGLYLAQAGEFGFVLLTLAQREAAAARIAAVARCSPAWCCRCWRRRFIIHVQQPHRDAPGRPATGCCSRWR